MPEVIVVRRNFVVSVNIRFLGKKKQKTLVIYFFKLLIRNIAGIDGGSFSTIITWSCIMTYKLVIYETNIM